MSEAAVSVRHLSKVYNIGAAKEDHSTLAESLLSKGSAFLGRTHRGRNSSVQTFRALDDVSFDIQEGEVVGIIGRNGAGKSTLLKILSRITPPTTGEVDLYGRVGSLLEVGTGFHPELTGRENIFLNGAILGISRAVIRRRFDEIVAFAEVEKFLDTPVKRYSSGMFVRLAFAVAAHLDSEILIVDEVLAVGDAQFQRKCLGKMEGVSKEGRTVFFVSHNMTAIKSLCSRVLLLDQGRLLRDGPTKDVVPYYLNGIDMAAQQRTWEPGTGPGTSDTVRLQKVSIEAGPVGSDAEISISSQLRVVTAFWNFIEGADLNVSIVLYTLDDTCVFNSWSTPVRCPVGQVRCVCTIPPHLLNDEGYRIRVLVVRDSAFPLLDMDGVLQFQVSEGSRDVSWLGKVIGVVRPQLEWTTETLVSKPGQVE